MLIYSPAIMVLAHTKATPYYNHSYDRYVRNAGCDKCGATIGEQVKYPDFDKEFQFADRDYNKFKFCPYCGSPLV